MQFSGLLSCLFVPSITLHAFLLPDNDLISRWINLLEVKLTALVTSTTNIDVFKNAQRDNADVQLVKINGEKIFKEALETLDVFLKRKISAVKKLVKKAEENVVVLIDGNYSSMLSLEEIEFFDVKNPPKPANLTFDSRFKQSVSFNQSGVHIPLKIFDGYPEIINGLNWTDSLDPVFQQNYQDDLTLRWQYFGSKHGFMRIYPAFKWPEHPNLPDLFDIRRRSWYIQGSVSPKDVIILIDRSGSVHGQTLDIMKITVRALLNSLGENDYVNVAWFNNKVEWVVPCVNTLVQATAQNRRLFSDAVERLAESNLTSYTAALDFAFEAFTRFDAEREPWSGSSCHKAILFLSDGGTDWPADLVTRHCNQSKREHIKIFTFACGPHPIPTVVLKEMACATGGYFSPITALGSVRVKIQDYSNILRRALTLAEPEEFFQWHNFYRDIGGLGMMVTLTAPVFNRRKNKPDDENFLGVMGMDIPVDEMIQIFPKHDLGLFGYPFAINQNGFIVFHPRLRNHIIYIEDPPDVDLTDLEGLHSQIEHMRRNMIDGLVGKIAKLSSVVPLGLGLAVPITMDYFYGSVPSSTFRFGIAVPSNEVKIVVRMKDSKSSKSFLEASQKILVAPWKFCGNEQHIFVSDLIRSLNDECDQNLINHVLWDVKPLEQLQGIWKQSTLSGVYSKFLMTSGGLTFVHPEEMTSDYIRQRDIFRHNLYKRSARMAGCVFSVFKGRSHDLTISCRGLYNNSYVTGVVGVEMERSFIQQVFEDIFMEEVMENNCRDPQKFSCFLLNDGGVIIATNQYQMKAGEFIGEEDPQLAQMLLQNNIYAKEDRLNHMSWCLKEEEVISTMSASQIKNILYSLLNYFFSLNWFAFYNWLIYLISSSLWPNVESLTPNSQTESYSCVTQSSWFYLVGHQNLSTSFSCPSEVTECKRDMKVSFVNNMNLVLVLATPICFCNETNTIFSVDPQDVLFDHCSIKERYRKRPNICYNKAPKVNYTECGFTSSGYAAKYSKALLNSLLIILVIKYTL